MGWGATFDSAYIFNDLSNERAISAPITGLYSNRN